jgi:predicted nucleic acid-binding protein
MARRTDAYVDTGAFIAFLDRSDTYHPLFASLFAKPPRLLTTPLVIAEGHGWFLKRFDNTRAMQFLAFIEDLAPVLTILPVGGDEIGQAARLIRRFRDQDLTLADAVGLHVLARQKIRACWSTDRHLALTGARLVIHETDD